jgi:hypothetical protein
LASGGDSSGDAKRDRVLEEGGKYDRYLQRAIDEDRAQGRLPSYSDDEPSEITVNRGGIAAKLGLPRPARMVIGIAIGVGIGALMIAAAIVAVLRFWPG